MMNGDESPPPPNNNHPENFRPTHPRKGTFSIIVRDLSYFCTEEDLRNLIREVLDEDVNIYIPKSKEDDGRSLLYGFIELNSPDKVEKVQKLHGKYFMGRNLR
jgi:RNA recognition motif-containing protein